MNTQPLSSPELLDLFREAEFGICAFSTQDGFPYAVPLNFVYAEEAIYLHCAKKGKKIDALQKNDKVCFTVTAAYSLIPSYLASPDSDPDGLACPAGQFFKSAIVTGTISVVEALSEKASALEALMRKLQPEGKYRPISADDPRYAGELEHVSVLKIVPVAMSLKIKLGQSLKKERRERTIAFLEASKDPKAQETARLMRKYAEPTGEA